MWHNLWMQVYLWGLQILWQMVVIILVLIAILNTMQIMLVSLKLKIHLIFSYFLLIFLFLGLLIVYIGLYLSRVVFLLVIIIRHIRHPLIYVDYVILSVKLAHCLPVTVHLVYMVYIISKHILVILVILPI